MFGYDDCTDSYDEYDEYGSSYDYEWADYKGPNSPEYMDDVRDTLMNFRCQDLNAVELDTARYGGIMNVYVAGDFTSGPIQSVHNLRVCGDMYLQTTETYERLNNVHIEGDLVTYASEDIPSILKQLEELDEVKNERDSLKTACDKVSQSLSVVAAQQNDLRDAIRVLEAENAELRNALEIAANAFGRFADRTAALAAEVMTVGLCSELAEVAINASLVSEE